MGNGYAEGGQTANTSFGHSEAGVPSFIFWALPVRWLRGRAGHIGLCMANAAISRVGVARRKEHVALRPDEERPERMIAAGPALRGDLHGET